GPARHARLMACTDAAPPASGPGSPASSHHRPRWIHSGEAGSKAPEYQRQPPAERRRMQSRATHRRELPVGIPRHAIRRPGSGRAGKLMRAVMLPAVAGLGIMAATPAAAQDTIRIGEINSYKAQPAFLDPYRKGW